jgi:hypothetical protein
MRVITNLSNLKEDWNVNEHSFKRLGYLNMYIPAGIWCYYSWQHICKPGTDWDVNS